MGAPPSLSGLIHLISAWSLSQSTTWTLEGLPGSSGKIIKIKYIYINRIQDLQLGLQVSSCTSNTDCCCSRWWHLVQGNYIAEINSEL